MRRLRLGVVSPVHELLPYVIATVLVACSSGGGAVGTTVTDSGVVTDATTIVTADGATSPPVDDAATGDDTTDAISVQPPIDDADAPATEAGPGGPWIAFASSRTGDFDIYLVHDDGTDLHAIVQQPGTDLSPAWSPDGAKVAFESNHGNDAGAFQIFVVNVASGAISLLQTGLSSAVSPAWSRDGTQIAFGGPDGIYRVAAGGGTATAVLKGAFRDNSPAWSLDGSRLYFSSNRESSGAFDVWSVQADGGALTQVTTGTGILGGPAVSSDGATIALAQTAPASDAGPGGQNQIVFFAGEGTGANGVFSSLGDYEPSFASDGLRLAVTSTRYGTNNPEVVVLGIPGATNPFRLTNSPGVDGQAVFQPQH